MVSGEGRKIRLYLFLIIAFSSTLIVGGLILKCFSVKVRVESNFPMKDPLVQPLRNHITKITSNCFKRSEVVE